MSSHALLCQHDLPSGKLCRQIALKDEQGCRHHMRLFRRAGQECSREEAEQKFTARLNQMDLPELLITLERKLNRIQRTMPAYHDARIALRVTIDRLMEKIREETKLLEYAQQHPTAVIDSPELQKLLEKIIRPMN